ncbi:MAG: hypothetical protein ACKOPO_10920 [Novosphingobium sp.]
MVALVQTFTGTGLPPGFGKLGRVRFLKSYRYSNLDAINGTNVEDGAIVLPQTSDRFCLIDGPEHGGSGVRVSDPPGADMTGHYVNHNDGTVTRAIVGGGLHWAGVTVPPGGKVQFHYIFLRGQQANPYNCFAQFRAVGNDGIEKLRRTFAQTMIPGDLEVGPYFRWRAHPVIEFPDGFTGNLQWLVAQGERMNLTQNVISNNAKLHPSGLALDFISIIP